MINLAKGDALRPFNVVLEGTKLPNDDGVIRQDIIKKCKAGDKLTLVCGPVVSEDVVKVQLEDGTLIGYIPPENAVEISSRLKKGNRVDAQISKISQKGLFKKTTICQVSITKYSDI
jgi:hypothetical protein